MNSLGIEELIWEKNKTSWLRGNQETQERLGVEQKERINEISNIIDHWELVFWQSISTLFLMLQRCYFSRLLTTIFLLLLII